MGKVQEVLKNPQQIEQVAKSVFAQADHDKNGSISLIELELLVKYIASECGSSTPSREDVTKIMRTLDTNTDSSLSFEEFIPFVKDVIHVIAENGF